MAMVAVMMVAVVIMMIYHYERRTRVFVSRLFDVLSPGRQRKRQKPSLNCFFNTLVPLRGEVVYRHPHPEGTSAFWPKGKTLAIALEGLLAAGGVFSTPLRRCSSFPTGLEGGRAFFNAVKEGDTVIFASDDEQDRILWVQAMYRATGQSHKPVPPTQVQKLNAKGGNVPQLDAPISQFCK